MAIPYRQSTRHFTGLTGARAAHAPAYSYPGFYEPPRQQQQAAPAAVAEPPPMLPLTGQERTRTTSSANFLRSTMGNNAAMSRGLAMQNAQHGRPGAAGYYAAKSEFQAQPLVGGDGNYFFNRDAVGSMIPYQNQLTASQSNVNNAQAAQGYATADTTIPAQAGVYNAEAAQGRAGARQTDAVTEGIRTATPYIPAQQTVDIQGKQIANQGAAVANQNAYQQGQIQNELGGQMIEPTVEGAYIQNEATASGAAGAMDQFKALQDRIKHLESLLQRYEGQNQPKGGGLLGTPATPVQPRAVQPGGNPTANPQSPSQSGGPADNTAANVPTVGSPQEAMQLPPNVQYFRTPDGRLLTNPNFGGQ